MSLVMMQCLVNILPITNPRTSGCYYCYALAVEFKQNKFTKTSKKMYILIIIPTAVRSKA